MLFPESKQKTAYEMLSGDWSSDVCSSDLNGEVVMFYKQLIRSDKFIFVATVES